MSDIEITSTETFSLSRVADLLCCGMEGGIGYWAQIETVPGDATPLTIEGGGWKDVAKYKHIWCALTPGASIKVWDAEETDELLGVLDIDAIKRGLAIMREKHPRHCADWTAGNEDAETGDVFIQLCVLGKITYG